MFYDTQKLSKHTVAKTILTKDAMYSPTFPSHVTSSHQIVNEGDITSALRHLRLSVVSLFLHSPETDTL